MRVDRRRSFSGLACGAVGLALVAGLLHVADVEAPWVDARPVAATNIDVHPTIVATGVARLGQLAEFDVRVGNAGGVTADGPTTLTLSAGGAVGGEPTASGDGWQCDGSSGVCTNSRELAPSSDLAVVRVRIPVADQLSGGSVRLTARVSTPGEGSTANDTVVAETPVVVGSGADLALAVSPVGPAVTGGTGTFRVLARNVGGAAAAGPVRIQLGVGGAAGGAQGSASGTGWSCPAGLDECTSPGPVAAGQSLPELVVKAPAVAEFTQNGALRLSAGLVGRGDAFPANDSAQASTPVTRATSADLAVSVSGRGVGVRGATASFRVAVHNLGQAAAPTPVRVALSPGGYVGGGAITAAGTGWTCPGDDHECTFTRAGAIAAGEAIPDLTVVVPTADDVSGGTVRLGAQLVGAVEDVHGNDSGSAHTPVVRAADDDVAVAVAADGAAEADGVAAFRIAVRNLGSAPATKPITVHLSPTGALRSTSLTSRGEGWACPGDGRECVHAGPVAAGALLPVLTTTAALADDPTAPGQTGMHAQVTVPGRPPSAATYADGPVTSAVDGVDLSATLAPVDPATAGQRVTSQVRIRNTGKRTSTGATVVQLTGPAGTTVQGAGWDCSSSLQCEAGPVGSGASLPELTLSAAVPSSEAGTAARFDARVTSSSDDNHRNDTTALAFAVGGAPADLTVELAGPQPGGRTFAARVHDAGTAPVDRETTVTWSAPSGSSASGTGWTCNTDLVCRHDGSAATALPELRLVVPVRAFDGSPVDTVSVDVSAGPDSDVRNNAASASTAAGLPDVDLTADVALPAPLRAGSDLTATSVVRNRGTRPADGPITVEFSVPSSSATATGDGWTCGNTLSCTHRGPVAPGAALPPISVVSPVEEGDIAGKVGITAYLSAESDGVAGNNSSSAETSYGGLPVDLAVVLAAPEPVLGGVAGHATARVVNTGTSAADGPVTLQLYAPYPGARASGDGWTCDSTLACGHPGPVPAAGALPDIDVAWHAPVDSEPATVSVTAHVSGPGDRNTRNDNITVGLPVVDHRGPAALTTAAGREGAATPLVPGEAFDVPVTVVNRSGTAVGAPTVTVNPSFGLTVTQLGGTGWSCEARTCAYVNTLGPGDRADLSVRATVGDTSATRAFLTTTTSWSSPAPGRQAQTLAFTVAGRGVDLAPVVQPGPVAAVGGTAGFRVQVRNVGGDAASRPTEVRLAVAGATTGTVTGHGSGWSCPRNTLRCTTTADAPARGALPDLLVDVPVPGYAAGGNVSLTATVDNDLDVEPADDTAHGVVVVAAPSLADLAVSATPAGPAVAGGAAAFDVTVRNLGSAARSGPVRLTVAPRGAIITTSVVGTGQGWACTGGRECVHNGDVPAGAAVPTLRVSVPVAKEFDATGGDVGIAARLLGRADAEAGNDTASATTPVVLGQDADLGVAVTGRGSAPVAGTAVFHVSVRNLGGRPSAGPVRVALGATGGVRDRITATGSGWVCPGDAVECVYAAEVAAGARVPDLEVRVPVVDELVSAGVVGLTATLGRGGKVTPGDHIAADDRASASVPVTAATGRDVAVAVSATSPARTGGSGEFRVVLRNLGGVEAPAPVRVRLSSWGARSAAPLTGSGTGWRCPGDGLECILSTPIGGGATAPELVVHAPAAADPDGGVIGLGVAVEGVPQDVHGNDHGSAATPVRGDPTGVDLSVTTAASKPVLHGDVVTFTSVVSNSGTAPSAGTVTVQLDDPAYRSRATGDGWTCDEALTCTRAGGVPAGGSLPPLTVTVPIPDADFFSSLTSGAAVDTTGDDRKGNNRSSASSSAGGATVDLTVTTEGPPPARPGETSQWTVRAANAGTAGTDGPLSVQISAPAGATAAAAGWSCTSQLNCSHGESLAPGTAAPPLVVTVRTPAQDASGQQQVAAYLDRSAGDVMTRNNSAFATTTAGGVPVDVTVKLAAAAPATPGSRLSYVATVGNSGTSAAAGTVSVQLSPPFAGATAAGPGWSCSTALVCDHPGPIAAGGGLPDLTMTVAVPATDSLGTSAPAYAYVSGGGDTFQRNNTASATTTVGGSPGNLIARWTRAPHLAAGEPASLATRVSNIGGEAVAGPVTVSLGVPFAATAQGDGWSCTSGLVCEHAGPVAAGGSLPELQVSMPVAATTPAGQAGMSASVSGPGDAISRDNSDHLVLPVVRMLAGGSLGSAYLSMQPTTAGTYPGGTQDIELQLAGAAPVAGTAATLRLDLPPDTTYLPGSSRDLPEPGGPAESPSWHVTLPAEGQTVGARFSVRVAPGAEPGSRVVRAVLVAGSLTESAAATFGVVRTTLEAMSPAALGRASQVSVSFNGTQLATSFGYALVRDGTVLPVTGLRGGGGNVVGDLDTSKAPPGSYDVRVTLPGGSTTRLPDAVTISAASDTDLQVGMVGPTRVRLNAPGRYYATVTNSGNVDAYDVPVVLTVPQGVDATVVAPEGKALLASGLDAITSPTPGAGQISPQLAADLKASIAASAPKQVADPVKPVSYVMAYVPRLPAGTTSTATFEVVPRQRVTAAVTASVPVDTAYFRTTQRVANFDRRATLPAAGRVTNLDEGVAAVCNDPALRDVCPTVRGYVKGLEKAQSTARSYGCVSFAPLTGGLYNNDCSFNNPFALPDPTTVIEWLVGRKYPDLKPAISNGKKVAGVWNFVKGLYDDLIGAADEIEEGYEDVDMGAVSVDPNEIYGPKGHGPKRHLAPDVPLEYTIAFENVKTASAAAQRVTIVNKLPAAIDPASVRIVAAEVGSVDIPLTGGGTDDTYAATGRTTLGPGRDVLFDVTVDSDTGLLTAHFAGPSALDDPFTPSPYTDFLPPNVEPRQGEGSFRITARMKPGLKDDTVIANSAAITFDDHLDGPTIATNIWSNVIDAAPPTATLAALPARSTDVATLRWTTHDSGAGGVGARVYRSVDDGPLELVNLFVEGNTATMDLTVGHRYGFAIEPVDGAGNVGPRTSTVSTVAAAPGAAVSVQSWVPEQSALTTAGVLTFTGDVTGVPAQTVALRRGPTAVPTVLTCGSATGTTVPCSGPVRTVRVVPSTPLEPGATYVLATTAGLTGSDGVPVGAYTSAPFRAATTIQDADLTGTWGTALHKSALGGRFHRERSAGARFTTTFTGTDVKLWYASGPDHGKVRVAIDGVVRDAALDQYSRARSYRLSRSYTGLAAGPHTLTVTVLGTRSPRSTNTIATIDAVSTATATCPGTTCAADPAGTWTAARRASPVASDGWMRHSDTTGTRFRQRFTGTGFTVYFVGGRTNGKALITVDGRTVATVNTYAARPAIMRYARTRLPAGSHNLEIVVTGKDGKSGKTSRTVAVDRVVVQ